MHKFLAYLKASTSSALSYRGDIILFVLAGVSQPIVILALWLGLIYSGGTLSLSTSDLVKYYLLVILVGYFSSTWANLFIAKDIRNGALSPYLTKPISYLFFQASNNIGEKLIKGVYLFPLLVILTLVLKPNLTLPSFSQAVLFVITLFMACALAFFIDICIGIAGFWLEDIEAIDDLYGISSTLFSGRMFPLILLPVSFSPLFTFLPFRYLLSFPIEIAQNRQITTDTMFGVLIQLSWLVLFVFLFKVMWSRGLRKYSAFGG